MGQTRRDPDAEAVLCDQGIIQVRFVQWVGTSASMMQMGRILDGLDQAQPSRLIGLSDTMMQMVEM